MENLRPNNIRPITPGIEVEELPFDAVIVTEGGANDGKTTITNPQTEKTEVIFHEKKDESIRDFYVEHGSGKVKDK